MVKLSFGSSMDGTTRAQEVATTMTQGYIYAKLVNDAIELLVIIVVVFFIYFRLRKGIALSSNIKLQLALMVVQSILFTSVDIW